MWHQLIAFSPFSQPKSGATMNSPSLQVSLLTNQAQSCEFTRWPHWIMLQLINFCLGQTPRSQNIAPLTPPMCCLTTMDQVKGHSHLLKHMERNQHPTTPSGGSICKGWGQKLIGGSLWQIMITFQKLFGRYGTI